MTGLLRDMQRRLMSLYDLAVQDDVRDYLVTDAQALSVLTAGAPGRAVDEKLVLVEGPDGVMLALYLDPALLGRLARFDPHRRLGGHNLADFWTVLEGISHFNYLAWNAGRDRPVTLLELEVQAEVDKYLGTRALLDEQPGADLGGPLLRRLFEDTALLATLNAEERERYRHAGRLAGRYCARLEARYSRQRLTPDLVRELRRFYRLAQGDKLARIRDLSFA